MWKATAVAGVGSRQRIADTGSSGTGTRSEGFALAWDLLKNLVQNALLLELIDDHIPIKFVQLWIFCNSATKAIKEFVLLQMLLDCALDLLHLSVGDLGLGWRCCLTSRAGT